MGGPQPPRRRGPDGSRPGPRAARLAFLAGVALVLAAPILLLAPPVTASHPSSGFSVSVTASPSSGSVPLTVTFSATVSSGTPVGVTWTFGDGKSWSGAGPSALVVSHEFIAVGTYSVSALVSESTGSASGAVSVNVIDGPLVVLISSTASNGTVPFTVTYHALVSGGTGTYTSFSWGFGDGGYGVGPVVQYTYRYAGQFTVTLSVIDSANDSATTSFGITAHPASASSSTAGTGPMPTSILLATAGVVGVGGLTWGVYWAGRRRPHPRARAPDEGASDDVIAMPPGAGSSVPVAPAPAPSSESLPLVAASAPAAVRADRRPGGPPPVADRGDEHPLRRRGHLHGLTAIERRRTPPLVPGDRGVPGGPPDPGPRRHPHPRLDPEGDERTPRHRPEPGQQRPSTPRRRGRGHRGTSARPGAAPAAQGIPPLHARRGARPGDPPAARGPEPELPAAGLVSPRPRSLRGDRRGPHGRHHRRHLGHRGGHGPPVRLGRRSGRGGGPGPGARGGRPRVPPRPPPPARDRGPLGPLAGPHRRRRDPGPRPFGRRPHQQCGGRVHAAGGDLRGPRTDPRAERPRAVHLDPPARTRPAVRAPPPGGLRLLGRPLRHPSPFR